MDAFLKLSRDQRNKICFEAEDRTGLRAASIEKDFWVCWTLQELFNIPGWKDNLTFKGGTSLSKCWGLINRFSEDIDIVIDKGFLGFAGEDSPEQAPSKNQKKKRLDAMKKKAQKIIHDDLVPQLNAIIGASLPESDVWTLRLATPEEDPTGQTLMFEYPSAMTDSAAYIHRTVKIEMGARSDNEPIEEASVYPYLFEVYSDVLGPSEFIVRALAVERTFWEKAMLLHEESYRPDGKKKRAARMSRHYYDLYCLIERGVAAKAIKRGDIFTRTAKHREIYFNWSWFDYSTLSRGTLRVLPLPEHEDEWRQDYQAMSADMFFGEVPSFDDILTTARGFQDQFNATQF